MSSIPPIANIGLAVDTLGRHSAVNGRLTRSELLDIIRSENYRLKRNVDKVLETCRLESGQVVLDQEPIDLHKLLGEVVKGLDPAISVSLAMVHWDLGSAHPLVQGDRTYLSNVFFGLLDNALKYSPSGARITIGTHDEGSKVVVEVSDNGPGIRKEDLLLVFEKFFRANVSDLHDVKGTGLGLYLAKRIVEAHNGNIAAYNNVDGGATIRIQLERYGASGRGRREGIDRGGRSEHGAAARREPALGGLPHATGR